MPATLYITMKPMPVKHAVFLAVLVAAGAVSARAEGLAAVYALGQARWSAANAPRAVALLTPENLSAIKTFYGPGAAQALTVKKDKVSGLLARYAVCELTGADAAAGVKYLRSDFSREISYLAGGGCLKIKEAIAACAPQSASLERISSLALAGSYSPAASAELFDGAKGKGSVSAPVAQDVSAYAVKPVGVIAAASPPAAKPLSSSVPALKPQAAKFVKSASGYPADMGMDGPVNRASIYWETMARENWKIYRSGEEAGAFAKAVAGAGFYGALQLSGLPRIEVSASRLGWDVGSGAGAGIIATDSARLAFRSAVFMVCLLPVSIVTVSKAALAGKAWAITVLAVINAGLINKYVIHFDKN